MVKRKADISLDKWLARGVGSSDLNQPEGVEANGEPVAEPCPTVTPVPLEGKTEPVTETTANVAGTTAYVAELDEGSADWFWAILEQSGYERW